MTKKVRKGTAWQQKGIAPTTSESDAGVLQLSYPSGLVLMDLFVGWWAGALSVKLYYIFAMQDPLMTSLIKLYLYKTIEIDHRAIQNTWLHAIQHVYEGTTICASKYEGC